MKILFFVLIPLIFSFPFTNITSIVLDFVPGVSTVKGLYEAYSGEDKITGENLTFVDRTLSFIGAIPFGGLFKNGKHLKNAVKFTKAAKRAKVAGKLKNAAKFAKAGTRAMKKAGFVQKTINYATKLAKAIFRQTGEKTKNAENEEN